MYCILDWRMCTTEISIESFQQTEVLAAYSINQGPVYFLPVIISDQVQTLAVPSLGSLKVDTSYFLH